jgi:Neuraminidase (sialidase)
MSWTCQWLTCPRYEIAQAIANNQPLAPLIVMRHGTAYCSECGAVVTIPHSSAQSVTPVRNTTITNDGRWNAYGGICVGTGGKLIAVCRDGFDYASNDGHIAVMTSADGGVTWSGKTLLAPPGGGAQGWYHYCSVMQTRTGRLVITCSPRFSGGAINGINVITSDDNGVTWSGPNLIFPFGGSPPGSGTVSINNSACVQRDNGDLLMPIYGLGGSDVSQRPGVIISPDDGNSWSTPSYMGAANSGYACYSIVETASGGLLAFIDDGAGHIRMSTSDDGLTWTNPGSAIPSGAPISIDSTYRFNVGYVEDLDGLVLVYSNASALTSYRLSADDGATWSNEVVLATGYIANQFSAACQYGVSQVLVADSRQSGSQPVDFHFTLMQVVGSPGVAADLLPLATLDNRPTPGPP